jgi:hypothetical protein
MVKSEKSRFHFAIRYLPSAEESAIVENLGYLDLPSFAAAHYEALKAAQIYRAAMLAEGVDPQLCAVAIFNQRRQVIDYVPFSGSHQQ